MSILGPEVLELANRLRSRLYGLRATAEEGPLDRRYAVQQLRLAEEELEGLRSEVVRAHRFLDTPEPRRAAPPARRRGRA